MAAPLNNLVLVSLLVCSGLAWENLPSIPAGRRAEYYLQHDDGSYKYGYDTGAGQSAKVDADAANEVRGHFAYVNKEGQQVSLKYSAGEAGFVPQLDGIPAPGLRAGPAAPIGNSVTSFSSGIIPGGAPSQEADGQVDADYDANADASYSFNIDTDSYKRTESSDSRGNIRGQYSYSSREGGSHGLSYIAGEGTGFVVTGGTDAAGAGAGAGAGIGAPAVPRLYGAPAAPASPYAGPAANTQGGLNPDGSYSFSFNTPDQSRQETADAQNNVRGSFSFRAKDDGQTRRVDYSAGAATGFVASGAHLPVAPSTAGLPGPGAPITPFSAAGPSPGAPGPFGAAGAPATPYSGPAANTQGGLNPDGSYSFSFSTPEQSREETADAQNNVRGSYSFRAKDDGKTRRVDYSAGTATGFVASGSHLPVAPSASGSGAPGSPVSTYSAPAPALPAASATAYSGPPSKAKSTINPDGSYSFSFNTDEQSREESADAQNNVRGSFSFRAKGDGQTRRVDYSAGAATGFVASGAHLPVAPSAGDLGVPGARGSAGIPSVYSAPAIPAVPGAGVSPYAGPASNAQGTTNPDGSYSFSYSTDDQSRQETADAQNNVRGSFSFRAKDDGQTRRVDYEAGAATGFVARGSHLPVAPSSGAPSVPVISTYAAPTSSGPASSSGPGADGSYSFSYSTNDQSREEAADPQGNVRGSFSFVAKDDGQRRRVDYEAGAEKGFIAKGAHLPASPSGIPAGGVPGTGGSPITSYQAPLGVPVSGAADGEDSGDASYSYSYQTDSSSKTESSDSQGNVQGEFSFIAGDGLTRKLTYTSRGDEGFIASGDHLPKAPAPGATGTGLGGAASGSPGAVSRLGSAPSIASGIPAYSSGHVQSVDIKGPGFALNKYLPPQRKTGYIFDSKA
ncbi:pro-resilin [Anabrus simplex]|uniref:pro-resilin n=1 Tax=Anabrus simplex TaxID=316456 RepID=UPI0035A304DB